MMRLPILEVDGIAIGQSKSIERFVAKKYGFVGVDDLETAQIDMIDEHMRDIKDAYKKVRDGISDEAAKSAAVDKFFVTDLPGWFDKLEKALKLTSTTPGVSVGSNLSHADLSIYYTLVFYWGANVEVVKKAYANCELIRWNFLSALSNSLV
jgi:glutathione S-transferase